MPDNQYDTLKTALETNGAATAISRLCDVLREKKDNHNLFYALLLQKRQELGINPVPTSSAQNLPESAHEPYEEGIREAARTVGDLFLAGGDIPQAWMYYSMIGEAEPVKQALAKFTAVEDDDCDAIVNIAYHQGVHPQKGFDLILDRYGLCSAITTLGGHEFPFGTDVRQYCIRRVVRALYEELRERLIADIAHQEKLPPAADTPVAELIQGRFWLFGDDVYHVDVSHLSAVVQMSIHLAQDCEEFKLARELCQYGERLSSQFQYDSDPPFEEQYKDYGIYLAILAGDDVEENLNHFRRKVEEMDVREQGTYPAEVLVNLLLRLGRDDEALEIAGKHLAGADDRQLTCPGVVELCERTGNYSKLAELAKEHDNLVHYLAGLIAARGT